MSQTSLDKTKLIKTFLKESLDNSQKALNYIKKNSMFETLSYLNMINLSIYSSKNIYLCYELQDDRIDEIFVLFQEFTDILLESHSEKLPYVNCEIRLDAISKKLETMGILMWLSCRDTVMYYRHFVSLQPAQLPKN